MTDTITATTAASTPADGTTATSTATPPTGTGPDTTAPGSQPPTTTQAPTADEDTTVPAEGGTDDIEVWKGRAREWEQRSKRNVELAARSPDLEARARSLEEQYEEAVGARARLEADLWRERAARAQGIPDDLFEFLTGSSEAEVMERAEHIAARVAGPPPTPSRPHTGARLGRARVAGGRLRRVRPRLPEPIGVPDHARTGNSR
ncbi:hypothetical protein ACFV42_29570 [Streptomyces solisilvae]|uniref:hypothetical protein n=1 Tax=Streptomyces malaysiensis TaxID=92644 RepID=UPI003696C503